MVLSLAISSSGSMSGSFLYAVGLSALGDEPVIGFSAHGSLEPCPKPFNLNSQVKFPDRISLQVHGHGLDHQLTEHCPLRVCELIGFRFCFHVNGINLYGTKIKKSSGIKKYSGGKNFWWEKKFHREKKILSEEKNSRPENIFSPDESTQRRERSEQETEADSKKAKPKDWVASEEVQEVHQRE